VARLIRLAAATVARVCLAKLLFLVICSNNLPPLTETAEPSACEFELRLGSSHWIEDAVLGYRDSPELTTGDSLTLFYSRREQAKTTQHRVPAILCDASSWF
jgi:hypothetical protein